MRRTLLALLAAAPLAAQVTLPPLVVSAARVAEPPDQVPFALTVLPGDALRASPALTLDGALRAVPGFSLFRRSDSLSANPTAQGVSLRGLGPSGASRSLVLLDGLPLNDPFGGWVAWTKVPREALTHAEILRGGGATAWGNAALGGIVQLSTTPTPSGALNHLGSGRVAASAGAFGTRAVEFVATERVGTGSVQVTGRDFATDGFRLVAPEDRGTIDQAAASRHHWLAARWRQSFASGLEAAVSLRTYRERRHNGTPYQRNDSDEDFGAVTLAGGAGAAFSWSAAAYAQDQSFASTFSAVNATRSAETPASDQYDVPATALGAAWSGAWQRGDTRTGLGADFRRVRGETREFYAYSAGAFTRQRVAGGAQDLGGLFLLHEWTAAPGLRLTAGGRLDRWRESGGHRRETDRATGSALRDDHYDARTGTEFSPSAGLAWTAAPGLRVRLAAQRSFRRPTLNELYRPFRVGNVITEANAALATEHATSADAGVDWSRGAFTLGAGLFWNELTDAVGNVTIARGPGTFPIVGFVPAGGLGRQRLNLDRLRVQGVELSAEWRPAPTFSARLDWLANDATVQAASVAPALAGRRLAQVPRTSASAGVTWTPVPRLALNARARWLGRQFEDDENLLRLGAALVVDLAASWQLTPALEVVASAENLTDARVETGRSADGIVNTGTPRLATAGLRARW